MAETHFVAMAGLVPFRCLEAWVCARRFIPHGILVRLRSYSRPGPGTVPVRVGQRYVFRAYPRGGVLHGCASYTRVIVLFFVHIVTGPTIPGIPGECWRATSANRIPATDVGKIRSGEAGHGIAKDSRNHRTWQRERLRAGSMLCHFQ